MSLLSWASRLVKRVRRRPLHSVLPIKEKKQTQTMLVICDIDGTIADFSHREHLVASTQEKKDWAAFLAPELVRKDTPYRHAQRGVSTLLDNGAQFIFLTGRSEVLREATSAWIQEHYSIVTTASSLLMRPNDNEMKPTDYKRTHLDRLRSGGSTQYMWWMCIDDDPYMWSVYEGYGALVMRAPHCWEHMHPEVGDLPHETNWRK